MIKGVIFDLWNTLLYLPDGWTTVNFLKTEFNISRAEWRTSIKPLFLTRRYADEKEFLSVFSEYMGLSIDIDFHANKMRQKRESDLRSARVYPDVTPVLNYLRTSGRHLGIISNHMSFYDENIAQSGLMKFIDTVLLSCNIGIAKPDLRIYELYLKTSGLDPKEILMVGDNSSHDVCGPANVGIRGILLDRNKAKEDPSSISSLSEIVQLLS